MKKDFIILLEAAKQKVISAVSLVKASLDKLEEFDIDKKYTPKELEPYDPLSDRFIRAVETTVKFLNATNITSILFHRIPKEIYY